MTDEDQKNQLRYEGRPRDSGVSGTQLASVGFGEGMNLQ